jgi:hypothetical protein
MRTDPYEAVKTYMDMNVGPVADWQVTEIVQTVIKAIGYSSCIACPECGAEVDTRTAEAL